MPTLISPSHITWLKNTIDRCDQTYYNENGRGGITDAEYDKLKRELKQLDPACEQVTRVGAPVDKSQHRKTVKHARLIGSIQDAMTLAEFTTWWPGIPCVRTLKIDGCTLECTYKDGRLVTAVTRGDGYEGEDVTANALQAAGLLRQLNQPFTGNIRGEVYMNLTSLAAVNQELEAVGEEPFANPRNAASGILRSDDGGFADRLRFVPHGLHAAAMPVTHLDLYALLEQLGFDLTVLQVALCTLRPRAEELHRMTAERREALDYWIDGEVYVINNLKAYHDLGVVNKRPKGAIAWKFPAPEATTKLLDVRWTVN